MLGTHHRRAAPRPDETFIAFALSWERARPTDARAAEEPPSVWFWKTAWQLIRVAQPNGLRLSCGALKKDSFHNLRAPPASSAC